MVGFGIIDFKVTADLAQFLLLRLHSSWYCCKGFAGSRIHGSHFRKLGQFLAHLLVWPSLYAPSLPSRIFNNASPNRPFGWDFKARKSAIWSQRHGERYPAEYWQTTCMFILGLGVLEKVTFKFEILCAESCLVAVFSKCFHVHLFSRNFWSTYPTRND